MKFYVYEWYNTETDFIFYVGKGCRERYKTTRKRNKLFLDYYNKNNCKSRIVKEFDTEEQAFEYENKRILELKSIGQCCCNLDYGGKGGCNFVWTDEMKEYQSKYNPMKNQSQRIRMSTNNPMKNKEISMRVGQTKYRAVIIGNIEYKSVKSACEHFNVYSSTIKQWCKKGINPYNQLCRYKDEKQVDYKGTRYNKGSCKSIIYKNKIYESAVDLARELHLHNSTISIWARRGYTPKGEPIRYVNDTTEHIYKPYIYGECNKKPIKVNGITYPSKKEAEISLGLKVGYLAPYLVGVRKNKKFQCEYVNQQPSLVNFDNSNKEGSTTNE